MSDIPIEAVLQDELAHGDVVLATIGPIMGHLLANHDHSLFSDEIVSRVRGMIGDIAWQLLFAEGETRALEDSRSFATNNAEMLSSMLAGHPAFLTHCHALALEAQLTDRLQQRCAIDGVLSPLLQALIASDDPAISSMAMSALAAQARFMQQQRRMELPLSELPGDLFHQALLGLQDFVVQKNSEAGQGEGTGPDFLVEKTVQSLRASYDESRSRLGLLTRLVMGIGNGSQAALALGHAGVAIFLSALSIASNQDRDLTVISTNDRQVARLVLGLRAAGLKPKQVEEQFHTIHPDIQLPDGIEMLRSDRAADLLGASGPTDSSWHSG
ncbi:MAG: hypothetical protein ACK5NN_11435 [Sphingomonadaceae bacterium]